jgi:hypothetical protein
MHDLTIYDYDLPAIEDFLSGDSRTLAFTVVDASGDPVDISNASVSWSLHERAYQDASDSTVLDGSDSGVELVTDSRVDTTAGEWEVRIDPSATDDGIYGQYWHRPVVEQQGGSTATWRGKLIITS